MMETIERYRVREEVPLRVAVALVGLSGVASVSVAGFVPTAITALLGVVFVLAAATHLNPVRPTRSARTIATGGFFVALAVGVLSTSGFGLGLLASLVLLAIGLLLAQQMLADTVRELIVTTAVGLSLMVLSLGLAPEPLLAGPLFVGWASSITTWVLARRLLPVVSSGVNPVVVVATRDPEDAPHPPIIGYAAGITAISVVAALVTLLLSPVSDNDGFRRRLTGLVRTDSTSQSRTPDAYSGGDLDMRVRGKLPDTPVAEVPTNSPQLWRIGFLGNYDGTTWTALATVPVAPAVTAGGYDVRATLDDGGPVTNTTRGYTVRLLPGFTNSALAPGHPQVIAMPVGTVTSLSYGQLLFNGSPESYTVNSTAVPDASATEAVSTSVLPKDLSPAWTALPPTVSQRTRDLAARITVGANARAIQVRAIERYLAATYRYTLDSAVPPPGSDAVDHFLFEAHEGFCEQFAAAEVVLLRSLGVPARIATGFSGGELASGHRLLRAANAHAWVEVYLPGIGWAPSDPTPPSASTVGQSALMIFFRRLLADRSQRYLAAGLLLVASIVMGLAMRMLLRCRGQRPRQRQDQLHLSLPAVTGGRSWLISQALARLLGTLVELDRPSPTGQTLAELAPKVPQIPAAAFEVAEHALYDRCLPPRHDVEGAAQQIENGRRELAHLTTEPGTSGDQQ
jgi:protein-glutamine gamma-glutamyltransferase